MKRLLSFIFLPSAFFLSSCACPHRKAEASHVVESFAGRVDGLILRETWRDAEQGGGEFVFTDPAAGQLFAAHTNQSALGGGSVFSTGTVTITAPIPPTVRLNRARNFRRESSAGEAGQPVELLSTLISFMTNISNPASQRDGEQREADAGYYQ